MGFAIAGGIAAAGVVGAYMTSQASQHGADAQAAAAQASADAQLQMYNQTRDDQAPYRQAGAQALSQMQNPDFQKTFSMSDFQADPGYDFRMQQGNQAIERSAAARGGLNSGATMKALAGYSQGLASDEYQNAYSRFTNDQSNRFNRLASIAGTGQTSVNQLGQAGTQTAGQIGQDLQGSANAQAAAGMAQANAYSGAINNGTNTWMQYQMMNRAFPQQQNTTSDE